MNVILLVILLLIIKLLYIIQRILVGHFMDNIAHIHTYPLILRSPIFYQNPDHIIIQTFKYLMSLYQKPTPPASSYPSSWTFLQNKQGVIIEESNRIYLMFRGMGSAKEWIDMLIGRLYGQVAIMGDAKVNENSYNTLQPSLKNIILPRLRRSRNERDIWIGGFSRGGVMAEIAAYLLKVKYSLKNKIRICTIGKPMSGNKAFVRHINRLFPGDMNVRLYNVNDPFCSLPCTSIFYERDRENAGWAYAQTRQGVMLRDEGEERNLLASHMLANYWKIFLKEFYFFLLPSSA